MSSSQENFRYLSIGQPPNQSRNVEFLPNHGKIGRAEIVDENEFFVHPVSDNYIHIQSK